MSSIFDISPVYGIKRIYREIPEIFFFNLITFEVYDDADTELFGFRLTSIIFIQKTAKKGFLCC